MRLQFGRSFMWGETILACAVSTLFLVRLCVAQTVDEFAPGTIDGTVTDSSGSVVVGAVVKIRPAGSTPARTIVSDQVGSFHFSTVWPGNYTLTIAASGFTKLETNVSVVSGTNPTLPPVVLEVAPAISKVDVGLPPKELAAEQLRAQEKQRLIGILPNFFVSYQPNAAPLTVAQKFHLGWKTVIDPGTFLGAGITAGIEQGHNAYPEFGQGVEGYGKRFGASYADNVTGVFLGRVAAQSILHQDPRYFYKGTGGFRARALYAIGTAFICKGDNGRWQPDFSDVIGDVASGEISRLYYPDTSRNGLRLFHDVLLGFAFRASDHLLQEFVYEKFSTHVVKRTAQSGPILREGTPVSLISVEDLHSDMLRGAGPINFVLAKAIEVDGVVVAEAGSKAIGQATYVSAPPILDNSTAAMHISLQNVYLKIGDRNLPLRNTAQNDIGDTLEYRWVEDTGRIALVLYLAKDVTVPPGQ
jgi:hypothetical protein